jgi:hypothetical protein
MALLPPLVIDVRIAPPGEKGHRVWIPFFLLWPLLLMIVALVVAVTIIADLLMWLFGQRYHHFTLFFLNVGQTLNEARGFRAHIEARDRTHVDVDIY